MSAIRALDRAAPRAAPRPANDHLRPVRALAPRATLFREDDEAVHLYEVASGTLRLTRLLETGRRQVVAFAHAGDVVGFPSRGRHHADCEALTPASVIPHRRAALDDAEADPALRRRLHDAAMAEIAQLQDHLLLMARKGACGKLAAFILDLARRHGTPGPEGLRLDLEMSRTDIADYLCLTIETVSRTLTRMSEAGLLRRDGAATLVLLDPEGLEGMAAAE